LTGERAGVLAQFMREQTPLPFQSVLAVPRADFQPIIPAGTEGHARNRRVEITITPQPVPFHPAETSTAKESHPKKAEPAGAKAPTGNKPPGAAAKPQKENP
jgi:hypothetical protein